MIPDPRAFYNDAMPEKYGNDYERARWEAHPLLAAQYWMMSDILSRLVLPLVRRASYVLEIGPGPGTWTKFLLEANSEAQYTLVDISREMLTQAQKNLTDHANVTFVESDLLAFQPSQQFDFFFSSRAIEYMPDKNAVCKKIFSLLAPGGQGVLITKMPKPWFDHLRGRHASSLHGAQISPTRLTQLLRDNGLSIERIRIATATLPLAGSATLNKLVYQFLKHIPIFFPLSFFAESYIVTFHKSV